MQITSKAFGFLHNLSVLRPSALLNAPSRVLEQKEIDRLEGEEGRRSAHTFEVQARLQDERMHNFLLQNQLVALGSKLSDLGGGRLISAGVVTLLSMYTL